MRFNISSSLCVVGSSINRSAQLTKNKDSFHTGFHSIRFSIAKNDSRAGGGRNSCQSFDASLPGLRSTN